MPADTFTAWYIKQPRLANQASAEHYGASRTEHATDESGRSFVSDMSFANGPWTADGNGQGMRHSELVGINLNDPPDLHQVEAIGFDFAVGWSTSHANIDPGTDWFETVAQLVIIAAVAWVSAGTLGPAVAGSMGMSTAAAGATVTAASLTASGIIVSAAVVGAATSLASGLLNDNLTLKGVLRGALAGALTAGLMQGVSSAFGVTATNPFTTVGGIAARTTVQGAVQALMGGKFADGALAGLASGLAEAASANLLSGINEAVTNGSMTASAAVAARTFARVIGSAIRAAANPDDPGRAFASAFLDDVFKQIDTSAPITQTAFDDEGRLNLGIVDPNASPEQQAQQLAAQLQRQGIPPAQANLMAQQALGNIVDGVAQLPQPPAQTVTAPTNPSTPTTPTSPSTTNDPAAIWTAADGRAVLPAAGTQPVGTPRAFEGDQPAFPDASMLPAGAQVTALRDDAGRIFWRVVASGVDVVVAGTATTLPSSPTDPTVTQLETVVITGRRIPRFESVDEQGNTLVTQGNAASLTTLAGTTLVATQMGEGLALGEGATTAARVLAGLARLASMPAAVLMLLFTPTNATEQFVDLAPGERFRTRPGELYGELQVQSADGRWLSMPGQVRLDQLQGRSMLSDEERDRIGAPLTTPISPQQTPPLVTPIPADNERLPPLPGLEIQEPTGPTITTTPADPQNWRDLIIDKRNSKILGDNLRAGGADKPGTGYEAHHTVPSEAGGPRMDALRAKLLLLDIKLNDATNGVWLPGPDVSRDATDAYHRRLNNKDYNNAVADVFDKITSKDAALDALRDISNQLKDGSFPGVRPRPKP